LQKLLMPVSPYILELRRHIGHQMLCLPGIKALVINDRREILLQKNRDTGTWMPIGGTVEPGEQPADAAVREVFEETAVRVAAIRLIGVYAGPDVTYPNGDHVIYQTLSFLCKPISGTPRVNDDESLDVAYFPLNALPPLRADQELAIEHALANRPEAFFISSQK
jgi:8-oxo-dGTP pyrophosphatase MutT (NUDIX family)